MYKYLIIVIFVFSKTVFSQEINGKVNYGFINAIDIGEKRGIDYNAMLVFNKLQSYYVTAKDSLETTENKYKKYQFNVEESNGVSVYDGMALSKKGEQVVNAINKKTMWSSFYINNKEYYEKEPTAKIAWKITNETKKIGKFNCRKAVAKFRGRVYDAWFTTDIPISFGPWKLQGLPGLILEAYDKGMYVYWYYKSLEMPIKTNERPKYLSIPLNSKVFTLVEMVNFYENVIDKNNDKARIVEKQHPGVFINLSDTCHTFIECEKD